MTIINLILGSEKCNNTEFDCELGMPKCIPRLWVCDGENECNNGKDETAEACSKNFNKLNCKRAFYFWT